jgi:thioredoxin-like negative regulator of GroEL
MLFAVAALLSLQDAGIDWKKDYAAALLQAQKDGRYVVVYFGGPDCPPCEQMKKTTFRDAGVIAAVNKAYVNVGVHLDGPNETAKQFGVEVIPTLFLVTSDGTRVRKWEGYIGPEDYRKGLESAVGAFGKVKVLEPKLKLDPDSLELNLEAAGLYEALGRARGAADAVKRAAGRTDDAKAHAKLLIRVLGQLYAMETDEALNVEILTVAAEAEKLDAAQRGEALAARAQVAMNREKHDDAIALFEEVAEKHPTCDKAAISLLWLADLYHHAKKDNAKAKKTLERLLEKYSKSDVVDDAKAMLEHLKAHE